MPEDVGGQLVRRVVVRADHLERVEVVESGRCRGAAPFRGGAVTARGTVRGTVRSRGGGGGRGPFPPIALGLGCSALADFGGINVKVQGDAPNGRVRVGTEGKLADLDDPGPVGVPAAGLARRCFRERDLHYNVIRVRVVAVATHSGRLDPKGSVLQHHTHFVVDQMLGAELIAPVGIAPPHEEGDLQLVGGIQWDGSIVRWRRTAARPLLAPAGIVVGVQWLSRGVGVVVVRCRVDPTPFGVAEVAHELVQVPPTIVAEGEAVSERCPLVHLVKSLLVQRLNVDVGRQRVALRFGVGEPGRARTLDAWIVDAGAAAPERTGGWFQRTPGEKVDLSQKTEEYCIQCLCRSASGAVIGVHVPRPGHDPRQAWLGPVRLQVDETRPLQVEQAGHLELLFPMRVRARSAKRTGPVVDVVHAHFRLNPGLPDQCCRVVVRERRLPSPSPRAEGRGSPGSRRRPSQQRCPGAGSVPPDGVRTPETAGDRRVEREAGGVLGVVIADGAEHGWRANRLAIAQWRRKRRSEAVRRWWRTSASAVLRRGLIVAVARDRDEAVRGFALPSPSSSHS